MKKLLSGMCATALAATFAVTSVVPANAAPVFVPRAQAVQPQSDVIQVQDGIIYKKRLRRGNRNGNWSNDGGGIDDTIRRNARRGNWNNGGNWNGNNYGWYNGHRGYPYKRPGYRRHNGLWFPAGAFIAGAIIGGAIANNNNYSSGGGNAHERWCYDQYRSYREWDNTWQPYNGPRRVCNSPYDGY